MRFFRSAEVKERLLLADLGHEEAKIPGSNLFKNFVRKPDAKFRFKFWQLLKSDKNWLPYWPIITS